MTKLISWNVNGIRAVAKKGLQDLIGEMAPDILCFQETKAQDDQVEEVVKDYGFHYCSNSAVKKGYSGTAILSKEKPLSILKGIGIEEHDQEGRVLTAEFEKFYVVNVYVPNSQNGLKRIDYREKWDRDFFDYYNTLVEKKPVIVCGDLNVAHQAIDLKNDKANYNKNPGYTQREIDGLELMLNGGFVDSFRHFYPEEEKYSWWSYRMNARERNVGWRIDYVLISKDFIPQVEDSFILNDIHGSDHCPVGINIK
jgi:exodeoxyribonuclease-3